ncbi:MAG: SWIM zinc finger family protein [Paraprevotella clara]|nr:SWIM zinc finger family protein [Paraprevotella clara]
MTTRARPFRPSQESATTCTCLKWAIYSVPCASA